MQIKFYPALGAALQERRIDAIREALQDLERGGLYRLEASEPGLKWWIPVRHKAVGA